ncbi:hypothetical protein CEXT_615811 [Caerostris extrusa]|uniref:Uncharacterized protein n=1 Tax=Caerostris extrusa TaxID=172846 RepID=A0AAV4SLV3_CAEEX|nr:hypothetical protein CEXT_615811 [Caerostris extrusa]
MISGWDAYQRDETNCGKAVMRCHVGSLPSDRAAKRDRRSMSENDSITALMEMHNADELKKKTVQKPTVKSYKFPKKIWAFFSVTMWYLVLGYHMGSCLDVVPWFLVTTWVLGLDVVLGSTTWVLGLDVVLGSLVTTWFLV